jgi:hypothetical protein
LVSTSIPRQFSGYQFSSIPSWHREERLGNYVLAIHALHNIIELPPVKARFGASAGLDVDLFDVLVSFVILRIWACKP